MEPEDITLTPIELRKAVEVIKSKFGHRNNDGSFRRYLMYLSDEQMKDPDLANVCRIASNMEESWFIIWLASHYGFEEMMMEG